MAEIILYTAARCLQGNEVRKKLDSTFAELYHDLDNGFTPINFILPWAPLPRNRRRDIAQRKMTRTYMDIINARRSKSGEKDSEDMLWTLMQSVYKDGTPMPDKEVAHLMIATLMAGQHSSSVTSSWAILRLASQPAILEELYQEQLHALGSTFVSLTYDHMQKLPLHTNTVRETLRLHPPIHSIMRKVKNPLPIEGTGWVVPPSNVLLAAPGTTGRSSQYFVNPEVWDPHRWENMTVVDEDSLEKADYGYGLVSTGASSPYLPFGAGRHRCIGEHFAYLQIATIIAIMVREFKFKNLEDQNGVVDTDYSVTMT